ncbi:hypothetical protein PIB30_059997 [Stylosanthes scabra]|uniref:DUF4283 domain-containing protein n=1 Tax=Stylosanthes scabra TaxID=79078 RepID=A0ABU6SKD9_9FABA|nr:hypothetical protein [Stylosanthes scabra]
MGNSKLELQLVEEEVERLERSLVGEALNPMDFDEMRKAMMRDLHTIVDVKMMGAMKLVMIFDTVANKEEAIRSPLLLNHFIDVRRWSPAEVNFNRRLWVEIVGIPAHAWCKENAIKIGSVWEKVIEMDES